MAAGKLRVVNRDISRLQGTRDGVHMSAKEDVGVAWIEGSDFAEGTIELERLDDVLYVGRPAFGQEQSVVGMFKLDADGVGAARVQVRLGRSSVNRVEIVDGLQSGDQVILSDTSAWDAFDRLRLN